MATSLEACTHVQVRMQYFPSARGHEVPFLASEHASLWIVFLKFDQLSRSSKIVLNFVQGLHRQLSHGRCKDAAETWLHQATSLPGADAAGL